MNRNERREREDTRVRFWEIIRATWSPWDEIRVMREATA